MYRNGFVLRPFRVYITTAAQKLLHGREEIVGVGYDPRAWILDFAHHYRVFMSHPSIGKATCAFQRKLVNVGYKHVAAMEI